MSFWQDFKAFAFKGNVMDLAVAVIIGGAFGKIVTALVDDIIMPLVGTLTSTGQKFTDHFVVLRAGKDGATDYASLALAKAAGANVLAYGDFIQTIVDFVIIAFFIFLAIRLLSRMQRKNEEAIVAAGPSSTDQLLIEIRDELKAQKGGN
jgi:large conductance mechanosensitive channel